MLRYLFIAILLFIVFKLSYHLLVHLKLSYQDRHSFQKANPALKYKSINQTIALAAMLIFFPFTLYAYFVLGNLITLLALIGFIISGFIYKKC